MIAAARSARNRAFDPGAQLAALAAISESITVNSQVGSKISSRSRAGGGEARWRMLDRTAMSRTNAEVSYNHMRTGPIRVSIRDCAAMKLNRPDIRKVARATVLCMISLVGIQARDDALLVAQVVAADPLEPATVEPQSFWVSARNAFQQRVDLVLR